MKVIKLPIIVASFGLTGWHILTANQEMQRLALSATIPSLNSTDARMIEQILASPSTTIDIQHTSEQQRLLSVQETDSKQKEATPGTEQYKEKKEPASTEVTENPAKDDDKDKAETVELMEVEQRKEQKRRRDNRRKLKKVKELANSQAEKQEKAKEQQPNNKPNMIIHIGPSKTGTSTIQKESALPEFTKALQADSYLYAGRWGSRPSRRAAQAHELFNQDDCLKQAVQLWRNQSDPFQLECWKARFVGIEKLRRQHKSVIYSDEAESYVGKTADYYNLLKLAFQNFNVQVVATYRRYFEWIISSAKEKNEVVCYKANWDGPKCIKHWHVGGEHIKINRKIPKQKDYTGPTYMNLDRTVPAWRNAGFNVTVLNFHNPGHITCDLYCDIVPAARTTCDLCRNRAAQRHNARQASMTAYNDIVYEAAQKGLIDTTTNSTRQEVTHALAHYHSRQLGKQLKDLPLICPKSQFLEDLLAKSLRFEEKVLPDFFASHQEEHREAFWKFTASRDFCWVDTEVLLEGKTSWQQVLEVMNTTTSWPITEEKWGTASKKK